MSKLTRNYIAVLMVMAGFMTLFLSQLPALAVTLSNPEAAMVQPPDASAEQSLSPDSAFVPAQSSQAVLVKTIDTALFAPPSTDPTGITYLGSLDALVISDSEVDETMYFSGTNIFVVGMSGALVDRWSTLAFSEEPTALIINPDNGHLFIADDNAVKMSVAAMGSAVSGVDAVHPGPEVTEISAGPDGLYFTEDDVTTFLPTQSFGSSDPEALAYDPVQKHLIVLDDTTHRIYEISPGANGTYDGIAPNGDDHFASYDLAHLEMAQLKGMTYNPANGHLYLVGKPKTQIAETTLTGRLVQLVDISAANAVAPSDVVFAPSSLDANRLNLYMTDRGLDNNAAPDENDGKIFEFSLPTAAPSANHPPMVDAGKNISVTLPANGVQLKGVATDDGLPVTPGSLETGWSQLQGPTRVTFAAPKQPETTVTLGEIGQYVLRLRADDGEATVSDLVTITVVLPGTNVPPVVEAAGPVSATVGQVITLTGSVTDDGLPQPPGKVTIAWAQVSGATESLFADAAALATQVTFAAPGDYVARLSAMDGEYTAHDEITIQVIDPNAPPKPKPDPDPDPGPDPDPDPNPDPEPDIESGQIFLPFTSKDVEGP